MTKNTLSDAWEGEFATPIDPDAIAFKIAPAVDGCEGCCLLGQRTAVCKRASEIAKAAGGFDCDERLPDGRGVIYQFQKVDPRQIDLVAQGGAPAVAPVLRPYHIPLRDILTDKIVQECHEVAL